MRIFKVYGGKSIEIIKESPYKMADDVYGIGFRTADMIALKLGIEKESYIRCRSGVLYTLSELSNEGHCYAEFEQLKNKSSELLDIEEPKIVMTADYMQRENEIIRENKDMFYLPPFFHSENGTAKLIKKIIETPRIKKLKNVIFENKINYDSTQLDAIKCACESKFMVLTGGSGTGKTTTTKGILNVFKTNDFNILLTAPTGRAAKRITEATGIEAKTIHRLLEFKPPVGIKKTKRINLKVMYSSLMKLR